MCRQGLVGREGWGNEASFGEGGWWRCWKGNGPFRNEGLAAIPGDMAPPPVSSDTVWGDVSNAVCFCEMDDKKVTGRSVLTRCVGQKLIDIIKIWQTKARARWTTIKYCLRCVVESKSDWKLQRTYRQAAPCWERFHLRKIFPYVATKSRACVPIFHALPRWEISCYTKT